MLETNTHSEVVRKEFHSLDGMTVEERVQQEHDYLMRFSNVLEPFPSLHCPEPIKSEPLEGSLWISKCPGGELHHMLAEADDSIEEHLDHIAEQIVIALEQYVIEFKEPFLKFATWNMHYEPATRNLYLLDIASKGSPHWVNRSDSPLDISLGCFLGASTYHTVRTRRASWRNRAYWRRLERLSAAIIEALNQSHDLNVPVIKQVSVHKYKSLAINGGISRRLWFSTAGQTLFNRRVNGVLNGAGKNVSNVV